MVVKRSISLREDVYEEILFQQSERIKEQKKPLRFSEVINQLLAELFELPDKKG